MSRENGLYYPGLIKLVEPYALRALHRAGHKRCLISIAEYGVDAVKKAMELENKGFHVIIDSGIYTLLYSKLAQRPSAEDCYKKFSDWLAIARDIVSHTAHATIVEWDGQAIVGLEAIKSFRDTLAAHIPPERVLFVWHRDDGIEGLRDISSRGLYAGITFQGDKNFTRKAHFNTAKLAALFLKSAGLRVHFLGLSSLKKLHILRGLFDSFDSTSWTSPLRYGGGNRLMPILYDLYDGSYAERVEYAMQCELLRLKNYLEI